MIEGWVGGRGQFCLKLYYAQVVCCSLAVFFWVFYFSQSIAPNNSNETYTFMCTISSFGIAGRFGQCKKCFEIEESKPQRNEYLRRKLTAMERTDCLSPHFCVIIFEPIMIQTCSAPQNDRLNFSFVKDTYVDGEKLARNGQKTATYSAASFLPHYERFLFSNLLVFNLCL